jgi:hypothetical protein
MKRGKERHFNSRKSRKRAMAARRNSVYAGSRMAALGPAFDVREQKHFESGFMAAIMHYMSRDRGI